MIQKQFSLLQTRRFLPLFLTQFLGAFNDNAFKQLVLLLSLSVPLAFESVVMWECFGFAAVKRPSQPEC